MRWSWDEFENTPQAVIEEFEQWMREEAERREIERARQDMLKRRQGLRM